jgi:hypothetical protein
MLNLTPIVNIRRELMVEVLHKDHAAEHSKQQPSTPQRTGTASKQVAEA